MRDLNDHQKGWRRCTDPVSGVFLLTLTASLLSACSSDPTSCNDEGHCHEPGSATITASSASSTEQNQVDQQRQLQTRQAFHAGQFYGPAAFRSVIVSSTGRVVGATVGDRCHTAAQMRYNSNYEAQALFVQGCLSAS
jgi:hypothetical protein